MKRVNPFTKNNNTNTKLQIVPWFSKKEWQETYQQTYSEDLKLQEKAYTQMCIWKARYPNLPLGVECTMSTLHVKLYDKQRQSDAEGGTYKDRDLQLLYSTAVMRFLNHLTVMSNCRDSMYKMAEQHKIPDWMINLRHEAAHGNSLPALYLLRQAADITLQWLKENYWEAEVNVMEDVSKNPELAVECYHSRIMDLLELWLVLKTNYWAGLKTIDKITNEDVRKQAMDLAQKEGSGIKLWQEPEDKDSPKRVKKNENIEDNTQSNEKENAEYTHKIRTAFEPLLRKLFEPLKTKSYKKLRYQNSLIDCLASYEGFCPKIQIDHLSKSEVLELMSLMGDLWKEVVEGLQSQGILHCLVQQLMSKQTQQSSAQLWLRLISQLIADHAPLHPPGTDHLCQILAESLPCEVNPKVLVRKANFHHMKHMRPIELKLPSSMEIEVLQKLAQKSLENPSKFILTYLHSLLSFWEPPLSTKTTQKLCALARIYNGLNSEKSTFLKVFTVASLMDKGLKISRPIDSTKTSTTSSSKSSWKLYSGDADWSQCALGALPW